MEFSSNNPEKNKLSPGTSEEQLSSAIEESGYPLQLVVASELSGEFHLQEEWAFPDTETQAVRTIDIVASRNLFYWREPQPRVRPALSLVIECKQSDLPYVFFLSSTTPWISDFPLLAGLKSREIVITSDDDPSSWAFDPIDIFGLRNHPFLIGYVPVCMTLSKCVRKGRDLSLSGSDAYQSLIFPLVKASEHFRRSQIPGPSARHFDCTLVIPLAVIDAPMVGVYLDKNGAKKQLIPWVRVARHQPSSGANQGEAGNVLGVDIVHKDFLSTYIEQHVLPFATSFADLALKHDHVLAESRGFVTGMGENCWNDIESRLKPMDAKASGERLKAAAKRISSNFSRKKSD